MKYDCISINYGYDCTRNPRCSFCYTKDKLSTESKTEEWFYSLVPYLKELTKQVALGSYGEPLLYPKFVRRFSKLCRENGIVCNLTTNGDLIKYVDINTFDFLNAISISFNNKTYIKKFRENAEYLRMNTDCLISANLLGNLGMVSELMKWCDMVYYLHPKNIPHLDITKFGWQFKILSHKYKNFYVDDLTKELLMQGRKKWKKPCHYGKKYISISPKGEVFGCSFDTKPVFALSGPEDIKKVSAKMFKPRYMCPYLL